MKSGKFFTAFAVFICSIFFLTNIACFNPENQIEPPEYQKIGSEEDFLTAREESVKDGRNNIVMLRGINAGGLFVTEHWMTGFLRDKTPSNDYRSLTQKFIERFGEEKTKSLWEEYRANWWAEEDFKRCADMGFNVIRLPFTYMNVDFAAVTNYDNAGKDYDFSALDAFVNKAAEYGMYTILDLHGAYGSQNGQDHSGQIYENVSDVDFYSNEKMMNLTAKLWGAAAEYFKNNSAVAGYDILNEPGEKAGTTSERHWNFYDKVYKSIRAAGDNHIVIFESCWDAENLPMPSVYGWENCMYSFHHYVKDSFSYEEHCKDWNNKIAQINSANFGVPLQMGEFTCYNSVEKWEYTLNLMNLQGWHWIPWTYKVWGKMAWGVENIIGTNEEKVNAADDEYEDILNKFKKLRTQNAQKYTFGVTGENVSETVKTLADIYSEYSKAPVTYKKLAAGSYEFYNDDGWLNLKNSSGINKALVIADDANAALNITVKMLSLNDGSFTLAARGENIRLVNVGEKVLLAADGSGQAARFYAEQSGDGFKFISYDTCMYLKAGSDGFLTADGTRGEALVLYK